MAFYEHTDPASGRRIVTSKAPSGRWLALLPTTRDVITTGHRTRAAAVAAAWRILDERSGERPGTEWTDAHGAAPFVVVGALVVGEG